ncbi:MAG: AAA family ATPase [Deltaproteobacteria bacterium]|nr:AAA family ATPase [Deltaproteobacteria bacterium]
MHAPQVPAPAVLRPLVELAPPVLHTELRKGVLGQEDVLRAVSLALYKHITGRVSGHILLMGSSGTGKTTIMGNIQRLYRELPELAPFRAMAITNANMLVDADRLEFRPERLLSAIEQRARSLLGRPATAEELVAVMERATICIDEVDKMATAVGGKTNPVGIVLQQGLLTMMEGSVVTLRTNVLVNGQEQPRTLEVRTGGMMFLCGGAFEGLYDQVYSRVTAPDSGEKTFSQMVRGADGRLRIEARFRLGDYFKMEDLYHYGMVPQFLARFDSVQLMADLDLAVLKEILLFGNDSPLARSRAYFSMLGVRLELDDLAAGLIAEQALKNARAGARSLRTVFTRLIQPLEYDPWNSGLLQPLADGTLQAVITAEYVRLALGLPASAER